MNESIPPVSKSTLFLRVFAIPILVALIAAPLAYIKLGQFKAMGAQASVPPAPTSVNVAIAQSSEWVKRVKAIGTLVASQGVDLSTEVAGVVKSIHFDSGQEITKDQLLLEFDNQTELATLGQAQAKFDADNSQYQRLLKLKQRSFVNQNDIDSQMALVDIARAQISVAQVALSKKSIRAPFSGKLGIRLIDIGEYISPGTSLVTLQSVDKLLLNFTLPESNFNDLSINQSIRFKVRSFPDKFFSSKVKAWSPVLDASTRNITVQAEVDNRERKLAPGMFAEIEVNSAQKIAVITLPETAIFYNIYGEAVYVLEKQADPDTTDEAPDYRLAARQVRVAYRQNGQVGIIDGVQQGDIVVTAGQLKLYPSLRVVIVDDPDEAESTRTPAE